MISFPLTRHKDQFNSAYSEKFCCFFFFKIGEHNKRTYLPQSRSSKYRLNILLTIPSFKTLTQYFINYIYRDSVNFQFPYNRA